MWSSVKETEEGHKSVTVNSQSNVMCANPSYLYELAKTVSQQLQPPGKKPCSDLNSIYMWINVTECTKHKGIYQDHKAGGGGLPLTWLNAS